MLFVNKSQHAYVIGPKDVSFECMSYEHIFFILKTKNVKMVRETVVSLGVSSALLGMLNVQVGDVFY